MKKIDLGQSIGILANIGVIIGIIFLAYEVSQNNEALRAQAQLNYMQLRGEFRQRQAFDPDFAEFVLKATTADALTDVELQRFRGLSETTILQLEWEFGQTLEGNLNETRQSLIRKWRSDWRPRYVAEGWRGDHLSDSWSRLRSSLRSDFVEFWEQEIIGLE